MSLKVEPWIIWLHRVTVLARVQDADLDRIVSGMRQRDRVRMWYRDDMTAEMASESLRVMTRGAERAERNRREADFLRTLVRVK